MSTALRDGAVSDQFLIGSDAPSWFRGLLNHARRVRMPCCSAVPAAPFSPKRRAGFPPECQ